MPYGNSDSGGDNMFSDGAPPEGAAAPKESEGYGDGQTAILPKSILAGKEFKPGEEVVLKIVAIHDNDVEVEYASEEGSKEEEAGETPKEEAAEMAGGGGPPSNDMASMME